MGTSLEIVLPTSSLPLPGSPNTDVGASTVGMKI